MANDVETYEFAMERGNAALGAGRLEEAVAAFRAAYALATGPVQTASALHMLAIAQRINGDYENAEDSFGHALLVAGEIPYDDLREQKIAAIKRDFGMVWIDNPAADRTDQARGMELFRQSRDLFLIYGNHLEAAVSKGFMGRAYKLWGRHEEAITCFRDAHHTLKGKHSTYELNNLIHLIDLLSNMRRIVYVPRVIYLIIKTGQTRRLTQALDKVRAKLKPAS